MKHFFKHKGFYGEIFYSSEDECYVGRVLGIKGMIAVHENNSAETIKELIESIDEYLMSCKEDGLIPVTTDPAIIHKLEALIRANPKNNMTNMQANQKFALA